MLSLNPPILIFGGPYGNLEATTAMKSVAENLGIAPDNTICTGDIVAYCGNPEETVNLIRNWGCYVVMGNCEESVGFEKDDCGCGFDEGSVCATLSIDWYNHCVRTVSSDNKEWMRSLPRQISFSSGGKIFSTVHGSPSNLSEFIFESSDTTNKQQCLATTDADCIVGGHCGIPFGQKLGSQYWLNSGVIGMPANDGQKSTWYMLIEQISDSMLASWYSLSYDSKGAERAMDAAGLPTDYRTTLNTGIWPSMSVLPERERNQQGKPVDPSPVQII